MMNENMKKQISFTTKLSVGNDKESFQFAIEDIITTAIEDGKIKLIKPQPNKYWEIKCTYIEI